MRYAIVDTDGLVTNVIEWDGETEFTAPEGCALVLDAAAVASPGDRHDSGNFVKQVVPEPTPTPSVNEFLRVAMGSFCPDPVQSLLRGNMVLAAWPTFTRALDAGNWAIARQVLDLALATTSISQQEHDTLETLMTEHDIP